MKRHYILIFLVSVVFVSILIREFRQKEKTEEAFFVKKGTYRIGEIIVDTIKREILFEGSVQKRDGWVQFLVYTEGYKWLKEVSAIHSPSKLSDLQKAIALLDWKLWDNLWYRKDTPKKLTLLIRWDGKEYLAQDLILTEDRIGIEHFIFLGSPYFDHVALEHSPGVDCKRCSFFPLEKKALEELFIRENGESGYKLKPSLLPEKGKNVKVIIRIPA